MAESKKYKWRSTKAWTINRMMVDGETVALNVMHNERRIASVTIRPDLPFDDVAELLADAPVIIHQRDKWREMAEKLAKRATHRGDCPKWWAPIAKSDIECTCGLSELLDEFEAMK